MDAFGPHISCLANTYYKVEQAKSSLNIVTKFTELFYCVHVFASWSHSKKSCSGDDGLQGGETTFPRAITTEYHNRVKVPSQSGKAVLFYNVLPDRNMDDLSQPSGGKVVSGGKYVANIWVWDPIIAKSV